MKLLSYAKQILSLTVQKMIPVRKNVFVFTSFHGHYSDSPKYISQKIHELCDDIKIVWLLDDKWMSAPPPYVVCKRNKGLDNLLYRGMAHVIVDNVYGQKEFSQAGKYKFDKMIFSLVSFLKKKHGQYVFTTWHGTPLKRMGRDQIGNTVVDFSCPNTTMVLGNQFTLDIMHKLCFEKVPMKLLGTPRNDLLCSKSVPTNAIKEALDLPVDKKVILYAPTFRNDGKDVEGKNIHRSGLNQLKEMDFEQLFRTLSAKFGGEWVLVCRFHYHVESMVDWESLSKQYHGRIINGNLHDDMAEYLACTDVLITDASSSMFDYMLTHKPCFLYFPDLDHYKDVERGFYCDIATLPFPIATDFKALIDQIDGFREETYTEGVRSLIKNFGYVDDENSSERVAKYILQTVFKNKAGDK
ncbi:MAG: CDP-glycerol glycerophosphotransferase family protein [Clostridia bacterium]|nr:CDP-glycerol glycerophosphotransferase family protein [Clostridia bacterium]